MYKKECEKIHLVIAIFELRTLKMRHCHVPNKRRRQVSPRPFCVAPVQDWFCHKMELFTLSSQLELKEMRRKRFQRLLFFTFFFCRFPTKLLGSIYCIINNKKLGIFSTDFSQDFLVWKRPRRAGQKNISSCINAWPICRLKLCMSISHDLIDKSVKYFGYILIWYPGIQLWKKIRIMTFSHLTHFYSV